MLPDTVTTPPGNRFRNGCLVLLLVCITVPAAGYWWWTARAARLAEEAAVAQEEAAEEAFEPVLGELAVEEDIPYDIDKTIRVVHEIDRAVRDQQSLESYMRYMATQDYRGVAPEVLEARREILMVLGGLYAKQVEIEQQDALWESAGEMMLSAGSVVSADVEAGLISEVDVSWNGRQAQMLLQDWKERQDLQRELIVDHATLETELFDAMMRYTEVYYRYVEEWDELSVLRDRAYLAAHNRDWAAAEAAAQLAIDKAPNEKEAHLILAQALIEQNDPKNDARLVALLEGYVEAHPESSAPAFALLGTFYSRREQSTEAQLALQQGAAYYPKQAEQLTDMLNPYKMRSFLRKSREGNFIVNQYKSTMLGAGYFSPDLQMARNLFDAGDHEGATDKVLDHFARRRAQQQWDLIISDIRFCHELLGPDFWQIFPEDHYLDLEVSPTMFGNGLNLSINNRSERSLDNATLVLVLHFTDMYPNDYEPIHAETVPNVPAHQSTGFGSVTVEVDLFGTTKTVTDIVDHRAILITNEAVLWVDTEAFKIAEMAEVQEKRRSARMRKETYKAPEQEAHPEFDSRVAELTSLLGTATSMELESAYGEDAVLVKLPRELSLLHPLFTLKYGEEVHIASDNLIEGDSIVLRFPSVDNFDAAEQRSDVELIMASPFGDMMINWTPAGDVNWRVQRVQPTE